MDHWDECTNWSFCIAKKTIHERTERGQKYLQATSLQEVNSQETEAIQTTQ